MFVPLILLVFLLLDYRVEKSYVDKPDARKPFINLQIFAIFHSLMNDTNLTAAKLTCPCNTLRRVNSFPRSVTGVVIDSEPHPSHTCKTSLLFAPLAVRVHAGCSAFPFYTLTKLLIRLHIKYKIVLLP